MAKSFSVKDHKENLKRGKTLHEKLQVSTLLDYERKNKNSELTSNQMWDSFQREEEGTMRFYRKGLDYNNAKKALKDEEVLKRLAGPSNPVWISMSIKHSRDFKTGETNNPYCVAYTINMEKFKNKFKANEILSYVVENDKKMANTVNKAMETPFPLFETQNLELHGYSKVNLGLFDPHVRSFNECVEKAEMLKQVQVEQKFKMKKVTLNGKDEIQEEQEEEPSETSTK